MSYSSQVSVLTLKNTLVATIPADPDDALVSHFQESVLQAIERSGADGLVLDISTVDTVDSFFARALEETARMVRLMGGRTVICGMRPAVAITATQLGLRLEGTRTALDLDRALELLEEL